MVGYSRHPKFACAEAYDPQNTPLRVVNMTESTPNVVTAPEEIDLVELGDPIPRFYVAGLPEPERSKADELNLVLWELCSAVAQFRHVVDLLNFCSDEVAKLDLEDKRERMRNFFAWRMIAARDGVMTLFHFSKLLSRLLPLARACPTIWPHIDVATIRSARRLFGKQFPRADDHRHVISHAGEQSLPGFAYDRSGRVHFRAAMVGSFLMSTAKDGQTMRCELSNSAVEMLNAIKLQALAGLGAAIAQANSLASQESAVAAPPSLSSRAFTSETNGEGRADV
jgi:F0F1-type ATP synthase membrane subunit c/vacuolar-type H+-ATPase subunit K